MPRVTDISKKVRSLKRFYRKHRRVPGYEEMLKIFGYSSKNAVYRLLGRLEELGYISRNKKGKLSFTQKITGNIKMLGVVQAGFPSPAEEELVDLLSLDDYLVNKPDATYMLKVSGDSMIDAGIHPDDLVLVEKGDEPRNNDIVIAQVDGEWTIKYFVKKRGRFVSSRPTRTTKPSYQKTLSKLAASFVR